MHSEDAPAVCRIEGIDSRRANKRSLPNQAVESVPPVLAKVLINGMSDAERSRLQGWFAAKYDVRGRAHPK